MAVRTLAGLLLHISAWALAAPPECASIKNPRGERFELGLSYLSMIPSGLPELNSTTPIYGPVVGMPLLGGTLQVQGTTGQDGRNGLSLFLVESTYRLEMGFPYLNTFVLGGVHWLHYTLNSEVKHDESGLHLGIGAAFMMGQNFEMAFSMRTYFQARSTIVFGGGFSFLL